MRDELITVRRYLHARPELSFQEKETAAYLSERLTSWGIEHRSGIGGYGIMGVIRGQHADSKTIALRADMDALAIAEQNRVPYKSLNEGVMHACGHDLHMSCLLGCIKILDGLKDRFRGTVKFIFQPAEETLPGGAEKMIAEGVLENPAPELIFAQHVYPELEAGQAGFRSGPYMASSDEVTLLVKGKGGHAAIPARRDDTVLAAARILLALEENINKNKSQDIPSILAFGRFAADGTYNVIPSEVLLRGTLRTFDEKWREKAHSLIRSTAQTVAAGFGLRCEVQIRKGYPALANDPEATALARSAAEDYLGKDNVKELDIRMTVEDFARYAQLVPACFFRLGTENAAKGISANLHTANFDVDEASIETGTGLMTWIALKALQTND